MTLFMRTLLFAAIGVLLTILITRGAISSSTRSTGVSIEEVRAGDGSLWCIVESWDGVGVRFHELGAMVSDSPEKSKWPLPTMNSITATQDSSHGLRDIPMTQCPDLRLGTEAGESRFVTVEQFAGWPLAAVWIPLVDGPPPRPQLASVSSWLNVGASLGGRQLRGSVLDGRLLWTGIVLNTACFAIIAWLAQHLAACARNWHRIHRGLCRWCAYPTGHSAVCSECGKPS
jgi:hypothetical protein